MVTISPRTNFYLFKYYFGICIVVFFITSCKKDSGYISIDSNQQKSSVKSYKEYIQSFSLNDTSAKHLYDNLVWENLVSVPLDSSRKLIYIPTALRIKSNIMNGLVLIENTENDTIVHSFYTHIENQNPLKAVFRTAIEKYEVVESAKTIVNYFTGAKNNFNGSIQFFTNKNKFLFTIGIENGAPSYFKAINKSPKGSKEGGIKSFSDCVDYYLTTFYDDGSSETEFLFQSCTRDCIQTRVINTSGETVTTMACGDNIGNTGGGGGGDGGVDILKMAVAKTVTLIFISKIRNEDGSTTFDFIDPNSLLWSTVHIIFIIDKNGQLVPGKDKITISGLFALDQGDVSYRNSSIKQNSGLVGTTEVKLEFSGLFTFKPIDVYSQYYSITVNATIRPGDFFIPQGTITYSPWSQVYQKYIK
jgi:hypothetical protein